MRVGTGLIPLMQKLLLSVCVVAFLCEMIAAGATARVPPKGKPKPSLVLYPACPCYHAVGEGNGETRVDAHINFDSPQRAGARLNIELTDEAGKTIQTASA